MDKLAQRFDPIQFIKKNLLFFILFFGFTLRLVSLQSPLWDDELLCLSIVKHFQNDLFGLVNYIQSTEIHPPLLYLFLKSWTSWFGYTILALRLPFLIFGTASIYLSYLAGKNIFSNKNVGLWTALFVSVLPMQIAYSQQTRPYIMLCFFGLLAIINFWHYLNNGKKINLLAYVLCSLIGLYLHYSFIFFSLGLASYWFFRLIKDKENFRRRLIYFLTAHSLIFFGFYWWLTFLFYKSSINLLPFLDLANINFFYKSLNFFEDTLNQLIWPSPNGLFLPFILLLIFLFKFSLLAGVFWQAAENKLAGFFSKKEEIIFLVWLIVVPLILFLFSPINNYTDIISRHLILLSLWLCLLLGWLIVNFSARLKILVLILFFASILIFDYKILANESANNTMFNYQAAAEEINSNFQAADLVVSYYDFYRTNLNYYLKENISAEGFLPVSLLDWSSDYLASRDTLGVVENIAQLKKEKPDWEKRGELKITHLLNKYQPKRIWLFNRRGTEKEFLNDWLLKNGWEKQATYDKQFILELYSKK